jgi:hypothetical protein
MKQFLFLSAFSLAACASEAGHRHVQLMKKVEERVRLPQGAERLEQYARYYAIDGKRVVATYITIVDSANQDYSLPVGQRRWLDNQHNLPVIFDGGCMVVNVVYDAKSSTAPNAFCNGAAGS